MSESALEKVGWVSAVTLGQPQVAQNVKHPEAQKHKQENLLLEIRFTPVVHHTSPVSHVQTPEPMPQLGTTAAMQSSVAP